MRKTIMMVMAVALITAACGGDDDSGGGSLSDAQTDLAAGIAVGLDVDDENAPAGVTQEDADCASNGMAAAFTDERIAELDLTGDRIQDPDFDISDEAINGDEAQAILEVVERCIDFRPVLVEAFTDGGEISEDSAGCLADRIPDDFVTRSLEAVFVGDGTGEPTGDDLRAISEAMAECLTDEEFQRVAG